MVKTINPNKVELIEQRKKLTLYNRHLRTFEEKRSIFLRKKGEINKTIKSLLAEIENLNNELSSWIKLFAEKKAMEDLKPLINIVGITTKEESIVGVKIPIFDAITFTKPEIDLMLVPYWYWTAIKALKTMIKLQTKLTIANQQAEIIERAFRKANQRFNLLDKKLIPATQHNINFIKRFLDDLDTTRIAIAKKVKKKIGGRNV